MRMVLQVTSGFLLVGIGLVGVVMPIMPGWIFLVPGLALLSRHYAWARRLRERVRPAASPVPTESRPEFPARPPRPAGHDPA